MMAGRIGFRRLIRMTMLVAGGATYVVFAVLVMFFVFKLAGW